MIPITIELCEPFTSRIFPDDNHFVKLFPRAKQESRRNEATALMFVAEVWGKDSETLQFEIAKAL